MAAESNIEKNLVKFAKTLGFLSFKFTSPNARGVPDRVFISDRGAVLFLEIKAPGKKPNPLQLATISKLRGHNVAAGWTDNLEKGQRMLNQFYCYPLHFNRDYLL